MHRKAPILLPEEPLIWKQHQNEVSSTPLSTPSLTNSSYLSSSNSSVCSKSHKSCRPDRSKAMANKSSRLSGTPQMYSEPADQMFPIYFDSTTEEPYFMSRSRVQSYDSATDCSGSPEPVASDSTSVWSQYATEPTDISIQSALIPPEDEYISNSSRQVDTAKIPSLQDSPPESSNSSTVTGMFIYVSFQISNQ
jgi:hypothetical protein